jgi:MFS family permease
MPVEERSKSLEMMSEQSMRAPTLMVQAVLCVLAALEGADNQLLGSALAKVQTELSFTLNSLTMMAAAQGIAANLASPFWGVLADRGVFRTKDLLIVAAVGQGFVTIVLACAKQYDGWMVFLRGLNGAFLAGLRPIANGIVAKETSESLQGKIFSRILIFIQLGGSLCALIVTPIASVEVDIPYFGTMSGWRPAWVVVGFMSIFAALFTIFGLHEEKAVRVKPDQGVASAIKEEVGLFAQFLTIPTFIIMVMQGTFGTIPWTVLWMMTRYYQLTGSMTDTEVGLCVGLNPISAMVGTMLGGFLADRAAKMFGPHGRPLIAQLTVALGIPFMYLNFVGVAPGTGSFWIYVGVNAGFGLFGNWAQAGTNWPILSQIVPKTTRSRVMALEGALENSMAAFLGPFFLEQLSTKIFKFDLTSINPNGKDLDSARSFGSALFLTVCLPWLAAFVIYSILHWTFPRDLTLLKLTEEIQTDENDRQEQLQQNAFRNGKNTGSTLSGYLASRGTLRNL